METKSATPKKYLDRLNATEEEKNVEQNNLKNTEADIAIQTTILETERKISKLKRDIETAKGAHPYIATNIYLQSSLLELAERELKFYQALRKEQF